MDGKGIEGVVDFAEELDFGAPVGQRGSEETEWDGGPDGDESCIAYYSSVNSHSLERQTKTKKKEGHSPAPGEIAISPETNPEQNPTADHFLSNL